MIPESADIIRSAWPVETCKSLNLYLGTGRCGGSFDSYGLQHQSDEDRAAIRVGRTRLAHADVWHRGRHGLDTMVPLCRVVWSSPPAEPRSYRQHLRLADGSLTTEFHGDHFSYTLIARTSPAEADRDLLDFEITWHGGERPDLVVEPVPVYQSDYSGAMEAETSVSIDGPRAVIALRRGNSEGLTLVHVSGDAAITTDGTRVRIRLSEMSGSARITLALGAAGRLPDLHAALDRRAAMDGPAVANSTAAAWAARWGKNPDAPAGMAPELSTLYWRSHYHLLCSYAPDVRCPAPPMGFAGNAWGFHFPQDLSYIHPALLAHGHTDITRAHVEFYHSRLANQLALTREIYGKPGVCWSWEFPIGPDARLFRPEDGGPPNNFQFEIHNASCPAKMAVETAAALKDPAWTRDVAWPMVRESARFLAACLHLEADGTRSIQVTPSMGQDEFGGPNAKNYLCALFATEYTLGHAVRLAAETGASDAESEQWAAILRAGLAYQRLLLAEHGFFAANESIPFAPRQQKHPVQLNPLWILPLDREPDAPTITAYRQRRFITSSDRDGQRHGGIPTGYYDGWTLFAFQLAATTLGDAAGYAHELREMLPARAIDPGHITIYESSGFWQPYYTTSMGLFMQAAAKSKRTHQSR